MNELRTFSYLLNNETLFENEKVKKSQNDKLEPAKATTKISKKLALQLNKNQKVIHKEFLKRGSNKTSANYKAILKHKIKTQIPPQAAAVKKIELTSNKTLTIEASKTVSLKNSQIPVIKSEKLFLNKSKTLSVEIGKINKLQNDENILNIDHEDSPQGSEEVVINYFKTPRSPVICGSLKQKLDQTYCFITPRRVRFNEEILTSTRNVKTKFYNDSKSN